MSQARGARSQIEVRRLIKIWDSSTVSIHLMTFYMNEIGWNVNENKFMWLI